jgi:hypothetical protein
MLFDAILAAIVIFLGLMTLPNNSQNKSSEADTLKLSARQNEKLVE